MTLFVFLFLLGMATTAAIVIVPVYLAVRAYNREFKR